MIELPAWVQHLSRVNVLAFVAFVLVPLTVPILSCGLQAHVVLVEDCDQRPHHLMTIIEQIFGIATMSHSKKDSEGVFVVVVEFNCRLLRFFPVASEHPLEN